MNEAASTRSDLERGLGWGAAGCWLASWFLPVATHYPGWKAFGAALTGPFRDAYPVTGEEAVPQVLSALTNVVFLVLFLLWRRQRTPRAAMFLKLAVICLLINLYWVVEMLRAGEHRLLQIGYYLWLVAFALLVALGIVNAVSARRTSRTPTGGTPA